jgi:hypothetical protein
MGLLLLVLVLVLLVGTNGVFFAEMVLNPTAGSPNYTMPAGTTHIKMASKGGGRFPVAANPTPATSTVTEAVAGAAPPAPPTTLLQPPPPPPFAVGVVCALFGGDRDLHLRMLR